MATEADGPVYSTAVPMPSNDAGVAAVSTAIRVVDRERTGCSIYPTPEAAYTVSAGYLYWLSPFDVGGQTTKYTLRSCAVEHCADSLQTLSSEYDVSYGCGAGFDNGLIQIDGENVYWFAAGLSESMDPRIAVVSKSAPAKEHHVAGATPNYLVANGMLYLTSNGTVSQCQASDCANTTVEYTMSTPRIDQNVNQYGPTLVAQDDGYLYLEASLSSTPMATTSRWQLLRVARDPNAAFEVILPAWPTSIAAGGLTLHGDDFYWAERVSFAQLLTCPKTGCVGEPTVLASGLNLPNSIAADDDYLYVLEPPQHPIVSDPGHEYDISRLGRILRCPLEGCNEPEVIYTSSDEVYMDQLKVDDRFIYFSGLSCGDGTTGWYAPCGFIAAIAKPE